MATPGPNDFRGTPFADLPIVDEPFVPSGSTRARVENDILGPNGDDWARFKKAHLSYAPGRDFGGDPPTQKNAYKLPIARLRNGTLTVFWPQLANAVAVLNGGRGGVNISTSAKNAAWTHAMRYYTKFKKERPQKNFEVSDSSVETLSLPPVQRIADLAADTVDAEARTVDLRFYSGAAVLRYPMFDDPYELEFEVSKKAIRMGRLERGAPILDSHSRYSGLKGILGVTEKAWISDGMAYARARFSKREDVEPVWQDVLDGIIRNVSMSAQIHELKEVTEKDAEIKRFRAIDWEPLEISLLGVNADPDAQVLSLADAETAPCRITFRAEALADAQMEEHQMDIKVRLLEDCEHGKRGEIVEIDEKDFDEKLHLKVEDDEPDGGSGTSVSDDRKVDDAIQRDKWHEKRIKRLAAHYGMDSAWIEKHVKENTEIECAIKDAAEVRSKRAPKIDPTIGFGDDYDSLEWRREQMEDAIAARVMQKAPPESARQYANFGFIELAHECLRLVRRGRNLDPRIHKGRILEQALALHTTSDFPLLLANALNKVLLPAYQQATPTYRSIAAQKPFNDFRAHNFLRRGDFPEPAAVNEHGEFTFGTISENREQVTAATYGRILGLSKQVLVNDDLGAFSELATAAGERVADFENATFFSTCITAGSGMGPDLSDSVAVYDDTAHANEAAAGVLSNTTLGSAAAAMAEQESLDGMKLNLDPRFLLVSPASWALAKTLVADLTPAQADQVNVFAGLTVIKDANLTGTRFYVLADPAIAPQYIYGYLQGSTGPSTAVRAGFYVSGIEFKVELDFGCGAIDYRAGATGAGA